MGATSHVSSEQKQLAMRSISSRKCEEVTRKVEEVKEKLEHVRKETPEYTHIERELMRVVEEKIEFCRTQLNELSTLGTVRLNIEYSPIPEYLKKYTKLVDVAVKTVLLPYMAEYETRESHNRVVVDLKFLPHLYAFNMVLTTEEGTVKYKHIRIPEPLREVIPVVATEQPIVSTISFIKETPLYPVCRIGDSIVKSFDNTTYSYELDDCYHILAADSSSQYLFSVLGKETEGKKEVKVFVHETEVVRNPPQDTLLNVRSTQLRLMDNLLRSDPMSIRRSQLRAALQSSKSSGLLMMFLSWKLPISELYMMAKSLRSRILNLLLKENIKRQLSNCIRPKVEKTKVSHILKMKLENALR